MSQETKQTTEQQGVVTEDQAREMRKSSFGSFDTSKIDDLKKEDKVTLTTIDKAMINHGLVKLFNSKVRKRQEAPVSSINYNRFLDICDAFDIPDSVRLAYTNRKALFTSQSDDLILFFKDLKPSSLGEISYKEKRLIIAEAIENILFDYWDITVDLTPAKVGIADLTTLCPIDSRELGINPRQDKLSNLNTKAIDHIFNMLTKKKE